MSTSNTSWDDTGFDADDNSGGFKQPPPPAETPRVESAPPPAETPRVESAPPPVATPRVESAPQPHTRVEPRPVEPPPVEERRSRWGKVFLVGALLLIVLAGGYIASTFFMRDASEQEAFYADPDAEEKSAPAAAVDTVAVATTPVEVPPVINNNVDSMPRQLASALPKKSPPPREPKEEAPSKPPAPPANALFVVQVFSSPSRDDADEWLQILRERNVADGFITEQRLGGEAWYRVRFGQFSSREDAETAAQQLGFSNPWIARVR